MTSSYYHWAMQPFLSPWTIFRSVFHLPWSLFISLALSIISFLITLLSIFNNSPIVVFKKVIYLLIISISWFSSQQMIYIFLPVSVWNSFISVFCYDDLFWAKIWFDFTWSERVPVSYIKKHEAQQQIQRW